MLGLKRLSPAAFSIACAFQCLHHNTAHGPDHSYQHVNAAAPDCGNFCKICTGKVEASAVLPPTTRGLQDASVTLHLNHNRT